MRLLPWRRRVPAQGSRALMLRVCYQRVTLPGTRATADRAVYVAIEKVVAIEELDPHSGAPNTMLHFPGGLTFAVRETTDELFQGAE